MMRIKSGSSMKKKTDEQTLEDIRWLIDIAQRIVEYPIDRERLRKILKRYE